MSIPLQFLFWAGFWVYCNENFRIFSFCTVLAGLVKPLLLAFLGLHLLTSAPRWGGFTKSLLGFLAGLAINYLNWLDLTARFFMEPGSMVFNLSVDDQSSLSFTLYLSHLIFGETSQLSGIVFYGLPLVLVGLGSQPVFNHLRGRTDRRSRIETVFIATLVYALVVPRMIDYSWIVILPAVAYAFGEVARGDWPEEFYVLLLVMLNSFQEPLPGFATARRVLELHSTLLVTYGFWFLYLGRLPPPRHDARRSPVGP